MIHGRNRAPRTLAATALVLLALACSHAKPAAATIDGTYRAHSGPNVLEFKDAAWILTTGARVFSGKFVVAGDRLIILLTGANHPAYDEFCRTDLDVYTWSLQGDLLTLRTASTTAQDRATGRACNTVADQVFRNGPWTKER
jgi:hypothetical protein